MIEADSVHSTPPLSTSASQTSRRSVLAGVASTLAAGTAIAAAATSQRASAVLAAEAADPVYAAIERHGKLSADFSAAVEAYGELEDDPDAFEAAEAIACDTSDALLDHAEKLFRSEPATMAGIIALMRYVASLKDWQGPVDRREIEEIEKNHVRWDQVLLNTLANALDNISAAG